MSEAATFKPKGCLTGGCQTCGLCLATNQTSPEITSMTENKHTVSTDALATLGTIIDASAGRDAIHLAVEPVVAAVNLVPGQDVGLVDGRAYPKRPYLGIVDPFLTKGVNAGEHFWLVVYPRQITSLRHVWTHPAFEAAADPVALTVEEESSDSETWLRNYADEIDETFNTLMDAADQYVKDGSYFYGDKTGDYYGKFEGERTHPDFWKYYQEFRKVTVDPDDQGSFFTCSC